MVLARIFGHLDMGQPGGIIDSDMDEVPARPPVAVPDARAGDPVAGLVKPAQPLEVKVEQLARPLALIAAHRLGRVSPRKRPSPSRLSQRDTVERARPGFAAMAAPAIRSVRRRCRISATVASARRPATRAGALAWLESATPPPARNRASHLRTVRTETAGAAATSAAVWPAATRATIPSRLQGVRRAI